MFFSLEIRYTLNYLSECTANFLNYLFMVRVKVTETINRLIIKIMCSQLFVIVSLCPQKGQDGYLLLGASCWGHSVL